MAVDIWTALNTLADFRTERLPEVSYVCFFTFDHQTDFFILSIYENTIYFSESYSECNNKASFSSPAIRHFGKKWHFCVYIMKVMYSIHEIVCNAYVLFLPHQIHL